MIDNFSKHDTCQIVDPVAVTATNTSSPVDVSNYNSVTVNFHFGECGDTLSGSLYYTCKLTECDTYNGTFTDVADAEVIDGTTSPSNAIVVDAPAEDAFTYRLGYIGNANYIKAVFTLTGSNASGTLIAASVTLGNARMAKSAQKSVAVAIA